jgi:anaerobic magnesium-protoporphyrin IX monomethyl ester cyclase
MKKPKIVLITIPQHLHLKREDMELTPNIAIVSLVNYAKKFGYDVDFYDIDLLLPSDKELSDYFKREKPDIIGISAVVSTSYNQVKLISQIIKKANPHSLILLGGHMAATANTILRKTNVDICILGDGEKSFVNIIKYVKTNGAIIKPNELLKIRGLAFINNEKEMEFTGYGEQIDSIDLPFPEYDVLSKGFTKKYDILKHYIRKAKDSDVFKYDSRTYEPGRKPLCAKMWVTKGCIGRCTFCQRFTLGFQIYDIQRVEKYIINSKSKYGVQFILLLGENFIANKKFCYEVAKVMKKHDILWAVQGVRCNMVNLDDLRFFKACGCTNLKYGIESGSDKILKIMDKKFTVDDVFSSLKDSKKVNLPSSPLWFCTAMPGETKKTIMETARFIANVATMMNVPPSNLSIGINYALPLPGSPLYEYAQFQGIIGKSTEEEDQYLEDISDMHAGKDKFINVTGNNVKKVLFWEYLILYESMRLFYEGGKNEKIKNQKKDDDIKEINTKYFFRLIQKYNIRKLASLLCKKPISGINTALYNSKFATYIPRWILYPLMENLLYIEYFFQNLPSFIKRLFGNKNSFIFRYQYKKLKYHVDFKDGVSLRNINNELRKKYPLPTSLTEKNQRILYLGR